MALEAFLTVLDVQLKSAAQAVSVLQQVACALAVAEEVLSFEHRDLHVGNVLVQPTHQGTNTLTLNGTPIFVDTQGIHVNIIDFTLSRLTKGQYLDRWSSWSPCLFVAEQAPLPCPAT